MTSHPTLSVAIITYNEEENIQDCLNSVKDWADEIIVLDSFSSDRTAQICTKFPKVQFSQHPFDGHVQQKNRAMAMCSGEWILSIDADERVSPLLKESILDLLQNPPEGIVGAKVPRLTRHMNRDIRHGGWYPHYRYRLIRKGMGTWAGENPHDTLELRGNGMKLRGDLIHLSFKDLSDQVITINNFSSIAALARYNKGKSPSYFKLLFKPVSKFLEIFLIKRGFLDGFQGFVIAVSSAYSTFLKEAKLFELSKLDLKKPSNLSAQYKKLR
ncbi:MAG: glycosyltransferase family 2 protein [SAR324 cluster bacterium]|nr:glycosyltransferase family 2 protein [SAR324 cluster bacterium]